ncbi:MAG: S9 family peptidase [Cyclobacteriaceae bacterium]|jgi:dipeptidyl aminopeptidase/acylaminoacyl peptidase|nr:prolyl oligopeptidase family serine peptidase [Flammeovirgaceae bacterium]
MKYFVPVLLLSACITALAQPITLEAIKSYPFPTELTAAATGSRIAWALDEQGRRNVYVAEGPEFKPRKLTSYSTDDGQEITSLSISANGQWVVYVRGGDHGSNWDDDLIVNPTFATNPAKTQIYSIPFSGGEPKSLSEGDYPVISPNSNTVAFIRGNQAWTVPVEGSSAAKSLFHTRGSVGSLNWSPDGSRLAFVTNRSDHSFVGVYSAADKPLQWIAPSFYHDGSPRWSPDGTRLAFVRTPGSGGKPDSILARRHQPWSIWTADVNTGKAAVLWKAPATLAGSYPTTHGTTNLNWAAGNRIVFLSYHDGWPHLYSIAAQGGSPLLLTAGPFMCEHIQLSADRKWLVFSANTGPDKLDLDRRHVARVPVDKAALDVMTPGAGLEWMPIVTGDGSHVAFVSATTQRAPLPAVMSFSANQPLRLIGRELLPAAFPEKNLVTPRKITFKAPDGVLVHADVFEPVNKSGKSPAIVYIHGGPPRQMLLGWHYSDYYSNAYASNQYLASLGFVVLSVNYRLGIGYGYDFHQPANAGMRGCSEYQDIKAAGEWLAAQPNVDANRIGVYGGSYGGYLTAMALGRDSKLFAAGVDIHGVHDYTTERFRGFLNPDRMEKAPDLEKAMQVAWHSSPVAWVDTWTSPVFIIHGDDDRNVRFNQSTDLVKRLEKKGVAMETLVIVDDTHHWMTYKNSVGVYQATADFFVKKLLRKKKV